MDLIKEIEDRLSDKFKREHCILTGSGTSAIYLILKALNLKREDTVLMPGICCFAPAYAVKYTGLNLDFCDISLKQGCLTAQTLQAALKNNPRIKAVIGVHLYGNALEIDAVKKICQQRKIVFIEDACQAYGSYYKQELCGSLGDFSVLSFGHTKILDADGGGAVLTDRAEVADLIRKKLQKMKEYNAVVIGALSKKHRKEYYAIQKASRADTGKNALFGLLWKGYKELFIHKINKKALYRIKALLKNEAKIIEHRNKLALRYKKLLGGRSNITFVDSKYEAVPWRFTCLIDNVDVQSLCEQIRVKGYDISNWYPNLANMFVRDNRRKLDNADSFEKRVINMWVDQTKDEAYVMRICNLVKKQGGSHGTKRSSAFC